MCWNRKNKGLQHVSKIKHLWRNYFSCFYLLYFQWKPSCGCWISETHIMIVVIVLVTWFSIVTCEHPHIKGKQDMYWTTSQISKGRWCCFDIYFEFKVWIIIVLTPFNSLAQFVWKNELIYSEELNVLWLDCFYYNSISMNNNMFFM